MIYFLLAAAVAFIVTLILLALCKDSDYKSQEETTDFIPEDEETIPEDPKKPYPSSPWKPPE